MSKPIKYPARLRDAMEQRKAKREWDAGEARDAATWEKARAARERDAADRRAAQEAAIEQRHRDALEGQPAPPEPAQEPLAVIWPGPDDDRVPVKEERHGAPEPRRRVAPVGPNAFAMAAAMLALSRGRF